MQECKSSKANLSRSYKLYVFDDTLLYVVKMLEELRWFHLKGNNNLHDVDESKVVLTSLNPTHIAAINTTQISKCFL